MSNDPRNIHPKPPFAQEKIRYPGHEADMTVPSDHGETSYHGSGRLNGKAALITGADSGIGRAVAIAFAREGADVAISYLPEEDADARTTAKWVEEAGKRCLLLPGDISQEAHCQSMIERTVGEFSRLDLLANIAAYQAVHDKPEDFTSAEFDRTMKTNIYAMFWLCREALKVMKPGSSILNTASIQALDPTPSLLAYATTKAAIVNFTKGLAGLAMEQGVRVNAVAPGPVWTPLIPATMPAEKTKRFGGDTVFKRPAQPVELAPLYVFLASDEASYVTGELFAATGGQTPL